MTVTAASRRSSSRHLALTASRSRTNASFTRLSVPAASAGRDGVYFRAVPSSRACRARARIALLTSGASRIGLFPHRVSFVASSTAHRFHGFTYPCPTRASADRSCSSSAGSCSSTSPRSCDRGRIASGCRSRMITRVGAPALDRVRSYGPRPRGTTRANVVTRPRSDFPLRSVSARLPVSCFRIALSFAAAELRTASSSCRPQAVRSAATASGCAPNTGTQPPACERAGAHPRALVARVCVFRRLSRARRRGRFDVRRAHERSIARPDRAQRHRGTTTKTTSPTHYRPRTHFDCSTFNSAGPSRLRHHQAEGAPAPASAITTR